MFISYDYCPEKRLNAGMINVLRKSTYHDLLGSLSAELRKQEEYHSKLEQIFLFVFDSVFINLISLNH